MIRYFFELVRFSHTLFALPFALASYVWASQGVFSGKIFVFVVLAVVLCRNTAMAFNRLVDASYDAANPRTQKRHLPAGLLSRTAVILFILFNGLAFIGLCWFINPMAFYLSFPTLFIACFYSLTKRLLSGTHFFLGLALGISPLGAWVAVRGELGYFPALLGLSLALWVAGFDLIYSSQDVEFDKSAGLKSLVVQWGVQGALRFAGFLHLLMLGCYVLAGWYWQLGIFWWLMVLVISFALGYLHFFRKSNSLDQINTDFFWANVAISFSVLITSILMVVLGQSSKLF